MGSNDLNKCGYIYILLHSWRVVMHTSIVQSLRSPAIKKCCIFFNLNLANLIDHSFFLIYHIIIIPMDCSTFIQVPFCHDLDIGG